MIYNTLICNTLLDVPEKIREFYHEQTKNEQVFEEDGITPVLSPEPYTYTDENGIEQTRTKMVPVYQDNTYIVENKRHDLKSWKEVKAVINNVKGKKDEFVDYCIEKAILTDKWKFHDEWVEWKGKLTELEEEQASYIEPIQEEIDNGAVVIDYAALISEHSAKEPVITTETVDNWKIANYAILRHASYGTWEQQMEMQYDGTWESHVAAVKAKYPKEQI